MKKQESRYDEKLRRLRNRKKEEAAQKRSVFGSMDYDEWGNVLPPENLGRVVETLSASGVLTKDVVFDQVKMESNHANGDFYGAGTVGHNYRAILEYHPVFIDPDSSLAGAYMTNFYAYRKTQWNPDFDYTPLKALQEKYAIIHGIGGQQHLCQDNEIALTLGFKGILEKIRHYRQVNPGHEEFYSALEDVMLGLLNWISRTAEQADVLAEKEADAETRQNLREISRVNYALLERPPETFHEACQLILWVQLMLRMYNGSGSLGRLDLQLFRFYEHDRAAGILDDEETIFHIACLLLRDTGYIQLGGFDRNGKDDTNRLSYLILEASHCLKAPANIGVAVSDGIDPGLLRRGVEIILEDRAGYPKFLGMDSMTSDFTKQGYPVEDARQRIYAGCHWHAIPGREYSHMDLIKVNLPRIFEIALQDMCDDVYAKKNIQTLWRLFALHLKLCLECVGAGCDIHRKHMHQVFPELAIDLFSYGPVEKGEDASCSGCLEYSCYGIDAAGLATVADSFGSIVKRIEKERELTYEQLIELLKSNWQGDTGEYYRRVMADCPKYGMGGSDADVYAKKISDIFTTYVSELGADKGEKYIPGIFGWANVIDMGKRVGATPNGRFSADMISHGANPSSGFRPDNAPTALLQSVARVQPRKGNATPAQLDLDPTIGTNADAVKITMALITSHFHDGGTQINLNIMDKERILDAVKNPEKYPELVVRVTGFSAYFISLSPEMRKFVVDRILQN